MGGLNCCQNQSIRHQEFRDHCQAFASPDYKVFFDTIQKEESVSGIQLNTLKQYIQGTWKKGENKTGKGVIFTPERFYYEGQIVDGKAKGQGKIIWPSKFSYKGNIQANKASGYGELFFGQKNISLKGNWYRGLPKLNQKFQLNKQGRHGSITFIDETEERTVEQYFKDKIYIKVEFGNNVSYQGQVIHKNNVYLIEETGTMKFPDGSYYIGHFFAGRMHGSGKYYWANTGHWFQGQYKANFRDGKGTYYYNHHEYESGEWKGGVLLRMEPSTQHQSKSSIQHEARGLL